MILAHRYADPVGIATLLVLFLLISGSIVFYLACAIAMRQFFDSSTQSQEMLAKDLPPVSLMIPACGLDAGAWENWSSLCQQDYPHYEILFGVVDGKDPAVPILEKLVATYPDRARLFVNLEPRGANHKDSILSYLLPEAQYEWIIFADSDIRVSSDYLRTVTAPLATPGVGMVTCAFVGREPQSLGAAMAAFGRGFDFIPSLLLARILDGGLNCAVGTTLATSKTTLAKCGGLHLNRIGSDYNLGKRVARSGDRVELSHYVLESDTGTETVGDVFTRELRWARTIRFNRGPQYYTMIFCYGTVFCVPLLLIAKFAPWAIALSALTWTVRYLQVFIALSHLKAPKLAGWLWALPLREVLSLTIWIKGAYGDRAFWRGRWLKIEGDGIISEQFAEAE
ncbi:glycosyltransferase [Oscillatoria sp. FACHB-1406]|uniref:glycosyltransferase n=1 Tax=Oscillatoria sp. FACHB-1406 TaxID=2692846 RepID=UPI001683DEF2|nr:glycosyltransferase [Oscillatoria sp. FACHB-1406]MBD2579175.1 glycosyltransferase [Oscillatoria sp. FACHB-1406]